MGTESACQCRIQGSEHTQTLTCTRSEAVPQPAGHSLGGRSCPEAAKEGLCLCPSFCSLPGTLIGQTCCLLKSQGEASLKKQ